MGTFVLHELCLLLYKLLKTPINRRRKLIKRSSGEQMPVTKKTCRNHEIKINRKDYHIIISVNTGLTRGLIDSPLFSATLVFIPIKLSRLKLNDILSGPTNLPSWYQKFTAIIGRSSYSCRNSYSMTNIISSGMQCTGSFHISTGSWSHKNTLGALHQSSSMTSIGISFVEHSVSTSSISLVEYQI